MSELSKNQKDTLKRIKDVVEEVGKDNASLDMIEKINKIINLSKGEVKNSYFIGQAYLSKDSYKNILDSKAVREIYFEFNSAMGIEEDNVLREKFDKELEKIQEGIVNIVKISRINALDKTDEEKLAFFKK